MLTWSTFAALKLISSCADAAVPLAASIARPCTSSRRESEPLSKRLNKLELIDSMAISFGFEHEIGMTNSRAIACPWVRGSVIYGEHLCQVRSCPSRRFVALQWYVGYR